MRHEQRHHVESEEGDGHDCHHGALLEWGQALEWSNVSFLRRVMDSFLS